MQNYKQQNKSKVYSPFPRLLLTHAIIAIITFQSCDMRGLECLPGCQDVIDDVKRHPCFKPEVDGWTETATLDQIVRMLAAQGIHSFQPRSVVCVCVC